MSLDLDAIRARHTEATRPRSSWSYALASVDDVPALLAEVERLRAELDSIREVEVRRLALKPGDVIVLSTDRLLSMQQVDEMASRFSDWFPGHETRVIDGGAELTIVELASTAGNVCVHCDGAGCPKCNYGGI